MNYMDYMDYMDSGRYPTYPAKRLGKALLNFGSTMAVVILVILLHLAVSTAGWLTY